MRLEDKLEQKYGRETGMSVPEGYFEKLFAEMPSKLPPMPEAVESQPRRMTMWQRVQPYVYMAAMFCGIWLMMKVFHTVSTDSSQVFLDNPPEAVVLAMSDTDVSSVMADTGFDNDIELVRDVSEQYDDISQFEADFGYKLDPQYASVAIPASLLD